MALSIQMPSRPAQTPAPTDETLLTAVARGDRAALDRLYERFAPRIFAHALKIVADRAEAEEITQELFLRVWQRATLYDPARGSAIAWLLGVTHNVAVNYTRRRWARGSAQRLDDETAAARERADPDADVEAEAWAMIQRRELLAALATLSPAQRAAIVHAFYGGLSHREVAERLGLPLGTVKSRILHGLRRLREHLERQWAAAATPPLCASPPALSYQSATDPSR
jgi:RNA polymerase sigma-70 factor (ECF subfamily)